MSDKSNIVLVGFMGTGKTTVGKILASALDMVFLDMDDIIVEREKRTIPEIFAQSGEHYFRSLERTIAKELSAKQGLVIATGGGIVLDQDNIRDFDRTGLVACLSATPEKILERVEADTNRPLLAGEDKMKKIVGILSARKALYNAIPFQINTTCLSTEEVAAIIIENYRESVK